jgi:hypothetical protein
MFVACPLMSIWIGLLRSPSFCATWQMSYKWFLCCVGISAPLMMVVPIYLLFQDNTVGAVAIAFPSTLILLAIFAIPGT